MSKRIRHNLKGGLEPRVYDTLLAFKGRDYKISYESEVIKYFIEGNYLPDWVLETKDGRTIFIEVKGYFRPNDLKKMDAVKKSNPDLNLKMVFEKNNRLPKAKVKRDSDWCEERNVPWILLKDITKEWILE